MKKIVIILVLIAMCISLSYAQNTDIGDLYAGKWHNIHHERSSWFIKSIDITKMKTGFKFDIIQYDVRGESLIDNTYLGYIENGILVFDYEGKILFYIDNKNQLIVDTHGSSRIQGTFKKSK